MVQSSWSRMIWEGPSEKVILVAVICMERWDQFLEGLGIIIPSKGRSRAKSLGPTQALCKRKWTGAEPRERVIRRDIMG